MVKIKKKSDRNGEKSFIIWMTAIGILLVVSYVAFLGWRSKPKKISNHAEAAEVVDPVCEMKVKPPAQGHIEYRAKHYYFCSVSCKEDFEKDPRKYLKKEIDK